MPTESSRRLLPHSESKSGWSNAIARVARAWRALILYEALFSLLFTAVLGPVFLALSYKVIELSGEQVLGNTELAAFLLSPLGVLSLVCVLSLWVGLLLAQFSGLVILSDGALRGQSLSMWRVIRRMAVAAPRLLCLAVIQTTACVLIALPFLLLVAFTYWLLLADADINYHLAQRPPRFWVAATIGSILAICPCLVCAWLLIRLLFALPAVVLRGAACWPALRASWLATRGRTGRLLILLTASILLEQLALFLVLITLDRINALVSAAVQSQLTLLVWSTLALLLFDAIVLQLVGVFFAIGRTLLIVFEYERAASKSFGIAAHSEPPPAAKSMAHGWRLRVACLVAVIVAPASSLLYAAALAHEFVEHRPVKVTAHRAGYVAAPENSIAALKQSLAAGADFVEIDVQQTADAHVILMHDRDLRRTTGDPRLVGEVTLADLEQLTLREALGNNPEPPPTLAQFLAACDHRIRLNIELKETSRSPNLPVAVLDVLREHDFLDRASVSCFQLAPLMEVHRVEPRVPIGMILSAVQGDMTRLPVDFLSLNQRIVQAHLVRRAHQRELEVHVWTVEDQESALRLLDQGCDNLITSDPALMRRVVDWYAQLSEPERMLMRLRRWMRD